MLSRIASAQENRADRRHQHQNPDDLEWQIVILEKQRPNVADIVGCRSCQRRKSLSGRFKMADYIKNMDRSEERGVGKEVGGSSGCYCDIIEGSATWIVVNICT